jgi:hypothetical protein
MIWNNDTVVKPNLPMPKEYGWELNDGRWIEVMTTQPPTPDAVIHLIKCGCGSSRCATRQCKCKRAGLKCTELCKCSDDGQECENVELAAAVNDEESDDESI